MGDYVRGGSPLLPRRGHQRHRRRKIDPSILTRQGMATKNTRNTKPDKAGAEKMKLRKVENRETEIRIDQGIFNREGREVTRRGEEKMKLGKGRSGSAL